MSLVPRLPDHAGRTIEQFLEAHVAESGRVGVVVGLSGGIDSAVTAHLARDALGASKVRAVLLPDGHQSPSLLEETKNFARHLGVESELVGIEPGLAAVRSLLGNDADRVGWGNVAARLRMIVLYAVARRHRALVVGTGNKSELLLGYFTKYGDGGVDLLPIGDLYKTQVRALAEELDIPAPIRTRPPTADLWEGQTDEAELGATYAQIDEVLAGLEQLRSEEEMARHAKLDSERVRAILDRVSENRHKRRSPPIPKLGLRTVGLDWRD